MNSQSYMYTLEWNGQIYDIFSFVRLIGQINLHIKSTITKIEL